MALSQIPETPQVTAPSPTEKESNEETYFPPRTRAATKRELSSGKATEAKDQDSDLDVDRRARPRDRSPQPVALRRRGTGTPSTKSTSGPAATVQKSEPLIPNGLPNGFLSPASAARTAQYYWREISRSPSPLGLIPIHKSWRSFIHRHEIPRKALHVSIGFITLWLYAGREADDIHPWLLGAAIPITIVDLVRHKSANFNHVYIQVMGAFMRETEVHDKYNGVIFYLLGTWAVFRFLPKDLGVLSVLLLSWCDTAASTIGRLYGRYTPRIRKGKSLAGSAAAAIVGFSTCLMFYGYFIPLQGGIEESFEFKGYLRLPAQLNLLGNNAGSDRFLTGWTAYIVFSLVAGIITSLSEAIDLFGIDDNLTIPILSGVGLWIFLTIFG